METSSKIWNRKFVLLFLTNLLVLAAFYACFCNTTDCFFCNAT